MSLLEPHSLLLLTLRVLLCTSTVMAVWLMLSAFRSMEPMHRILFNRRMIWIGAAVMSLGCLLSLWAVITSAEIELIFFPLLSGISTFTGCFFASGRRPRPSATRTPR